MSVAHEPKITIPELTMEEREEYRTLLIGEKAQDALEFQEWACLEFGPAAGILCRELLFWDHRGRDTEGWIYKTEEQLKRKGLSRHFQRKARETLLRRGVLEEDRRGTPCKLWYRLKLEPLMEVRFPRDATDFEPESVEPDEADLPDYERDDIFDCGDIPWCGCGECSDCDPYGHGHDDDDRDDGCFECGAVEGHRPWCSLAETPEEGATLNPSYSPTRKGVEQVRHVKGSNKSDSLACRTVQKERQKELQESSVFHTGGVVADAPPAVGEDGNHEPVSTTSTPSVGDSLNGKGTEEQVSTAPPETTAPMPAREAWAMYERGEVSLLDLEELCRPTSKEVA